MEHPVYRGLVQTEVAAFATPEIPQERIRTFHKHYVAHKFNPRRFYTPPRRAYISFTYKNPGLYMIDRFDKNLDSCPEIFKTTINVNLEFSNLIHRWNYPYY